MSAISINHINENYYFTIVFSRIDRNIMPASDTINGTITDLENNIVNYSASSNRVVHNQ